MRRGLTYFGRRSVGNFPAGSGTNPFFQSGPTLDLNFAGVPTDPLQAATLQDQTLDLNYIVQTYQVAAQYAIWESGVGLASKNFSDIVTFTRASTATYFDSAGVLQSAAVDAARFDYDPSTLALRGLLIEEQRTNSIRNNTMQGAVAPSTFPTNWQNVIVAGLTATVVGTGAQNGITYLDVRVNGTPSVSTYYNLVPDILVAGASGQTWTGSFWASLIAGSLSNTNANIEIRESDAAQGFLTNTLTALPITSVLTRYSQARTLTNASTAFVSVRFVWQVTSGLPVDFTLRIGLPQLELGAFATSVIPTTTTALTRSADVASVNTLSPWYNAAASTIYAEWTNLAATMPSGSVQTVSNINDTTGNNQQSLFQIQAASSKASANMFSGGVNAGRLDAGGAYSNATVKAASAYAALDRAISVNGNAAVTSAVGALPTSVTRLELGSAFLANHLNGYLRRVTYYPRRLANADLQTLTA